MAKFNLTDDAFNRAHDSVAATDKAQTPVLYAVTARQTGVMCGVADIVDLLTDHCGGSVVLRGKPDGQPFEAGETVLTLEGPFGELVTLETLYLGILSLSAAAANMAALVAAGGEAIKIVDVSAARFPPELIAPIAIAAAVGGARGTTTQAGHAAVVERFGLGGEQICVGSRAPVSFRIYAAIPPALPALFNEDLPESAAAWQSASSDTSLTCRLDSPGHERDQCSELVRRFGSALDLVWLDTPAGTLHQGGHEAPTRALEMRILSQAADRKPAQAALEKFGFGPGVTIEAVYGLRDLLDSMGSRSTRIMAGPGFDVERIAAFRACNTPVDVIAADDWVDFGAFDSRLVRMLQDDQWISRTGSEPPVPEDRPVIYQK